MYSKVFSGSAMGIEAVIVTVEADVSQGLPGLNLVGYLSSSVREASDRVRAAMKNAGYFLPSKKITVNLSPADIRKDGTSYDLAIAVSILMSIDKFDISQSFLDELEHTLFLGELRLNGNVSGINGVLSIVDYARMHGFTRFVLPEENAREAALVNDIDIIPVSSISDIIIILECGGFGHPYTPPPASEEDTSLSTIPDMSEIKGQETMKRGVIIAVAGFHNILMTGAAGSGKSMIAKCIPGIMPPLTYNESMELTKIYSVAGMLKSANGMIKSRPFRSPSQNISESALCGGGSIPKPGEVSLANAGILFLDEFPEFSRSAIEALRSPLEDRHITISRVKATYTYPSRFMLVAARNNCPCGFYPDRRRCRCTSGEIFRYQSKVSHPIMDRIDIRLQINPISYDELFGKTEGISSSEARAIITKARKMQEERYKDEEFIFNSELPQGLINKYIILEKKQRKLLESIFDSSDMSARGYFRMLRLARTIADIEGHEIITENDIEEAAFFRNENDTGRDTIC